MDWKTGYRKNKGKLLLIGASALVLALIAFSGICLGTLRLCGLWSAASTWGFWEFFGGLSVVVATFLVVRPLSRRRPDDPVADLTTLEIDPAESPSPAMSVVDISVEPLPPLNADEPAKRSNWRDLYDQLSREEQRAFKALMAKYFGEKGGERKYEG